MRRHRTQVTVWPAVADLMTVIAVVSVIAGLAFCSPKSASDSLQEKRDSLQEERDSLQEEKDSLQAENESLAARLGSLRVEVDSLSRDGEGIPACLGRDSRDDLIPLVSITVRNDDTYLVQRTWCPTRNNMFAALNAEINEIDGEVLNRNQLRRFAEKASNTAAAQSSNCGFWAHLRNGGVSISELRNRYHDDFARFFSGLVNPSVLYANRTTSPSPQLCGARSGN